ncbi:DNA polymerase II [Marispirochaeta aestuarii]|uniref:DNA polymerase II n=1 Tax=Marispirochaeta aestuarii TaxID=1963862 RepID=UPI0029C75FF6|nr:DNA polymerase II [Marispirochaeta aestuarii]
MKPWDSDILSTVIQNNRGRCYILTEESRDTPAGVEIRLHCIDDTGPLLLRFLRQRPLFFLRRSDRTESPAFNRRALDLHSFSGEALDGLYFKSLGDFYTLRRELRRGGHSPMESDIRPEERFLMERFIHRGIDFQGALQNGGGFRSVTNARIRPAEYRPRFSILSLDIETSPAGEVYCLGCHFSDRRGRESGVVHMVDPAGVSESENRDYRILCSPDEAGMLRKSLDWIRRADPDLIIGWNVIGFDLEILTKRCARFGIPFSLGRDGGGVRSFQKQSGMRSAEISGRIVLDGPQILRGGFHRFENYSLETVANTLLGTGKTISPEEDKLGEIQRLFSDDKASLARYNFEDCRLVSRIFAATGILEQYVTRSLVTGLRLDKVSMSVAAFDFFYLPRLHREGYAAVDIADINMAEHAAGGHVFTSQPGRYSHVVVLDFRSLYPSIIRTFNIDPLARLTADEDPGPTPAGIFFNRRRSILPEHIGGLLERRAEAKRSGDEALSQAVKILMNSFYGVMGTPGCRFYHPDLPTAITGSGQWVLKTTAAQLTEEGYTVLYGDTDSVFVQLREKETDDAEEAALRIVSRINSFFSERISREFGARSHLELEFEKHYDLFFLPPMRSSGEGARKRYVGRIADSGEIEFRGMESVRSDWTELARTFQRELFRRYFNEEEIPEWLRQTVAEIQGGRRDHELVYRRRLTKQAAGYTKNVPPHVRAARLLDPSGRRNVRSIDYLMTPEGPIPLQHRPTQIDYAHYIEKQIKPIADGVLPFLNTSFDEIIEGRQLELF